MNITEKELKELNNYARILCAGNEGAYPDDIVQNAIIEAIENNKTLHDIKPIIRKLVLGSRDNGENINIHKAFSTSETTRFCKGCQQDIPMGGWKINRYKNKHKEIIAHVCNDCLKKWYNQHLKKRRDVDKVYKKLISSQTNKRQKDKRVLARIKLKGYLRVAHSILEDKRKAS